MGKTCQWNSETLVKAINNIRSGEGIRKSAKLYGNFV